MSEEQPRQPRPRGQVEADVAFALSRFGPLSRRSLAVNLPGKHLAEADVADALERMMSVGLVVRDSGGSYRLDKAMAAQLARQAVEEEGRAYRSRPVEETIFRYERS